MTKKVAVFVMSVIINGYTGVEGYSAAFFNII
jgi:hypothetical protein